MTRIRLEDLALVTGGCQQPQPPQPAQAAQDPSQGAAAAQQSSSAGFMHGFDQFLSFLQTDSFQQLLGGIKGILGQFGGTQPPAQPTSPAA